MAQDTKASPLANRSPLLRSKGIGRQKVLVSPDSDDENEGNVDEDDNNKEIEDAATSNRA